MSLGADLDWTIGMDSPSFVITSEVLGHMLGCVGIGTVLENVSLRSWDHILALLAHCVGRV